MPTLDRMVNNDFLRISKSLLPYLNPDKQRPVAILIKAVELMYTIDLYSREDMVRSMTRSHEEGWERNFLNDVKNNLPNDRAYFIDVILKLAEARELLSTRHDAFPHEEAPTYSLHPSDSSIPVNSSNASTSVPVAPPTSSAEVTDTKKNSNAISPNQIIDNLSPLLEPSQVQLLKVLSTFMK